MSKQLSWHKQAEMITRMRRKACEEFGLSPEHELVKRLERLHTFWDWDVFNSLKAAMNNLSAEKVQIDRVADHVPSQTDFEGGTLDIGTAISPSGPNPTISLATPQLTKHFLVVGLAGAGKTTYVRSLLTQIEKLAPHIRVLLYDPNHSYMKLVESGEWLNIHWSETRINRFRAPKGYPYAQWLSANVDALGRGELMHSRYLIRSRLKKLFADAGIPEFDDGDCLPPSLFDLRDELTRRARPGSREEAYRESALNLIQGRLDSTGSIYSCNRGMEDVLADNRVRIGMDGLRPLQSVTDYMNNLNQFLFCDYSMQPRIEPPDTRTLIVVEEAQTLLGQDSNSSVPLYEELLLQSRSLGIGFVFLAQDLSEISPLVFSAVSNYAIFAQASSSSKRIARSVADLSERETSLLGTLKPGECFLRFAGHPSFPHAFLARITP